MKIRTTIIWGAVCTLLASCGGSEPSDTTETMIVRDNTQEVLDYYAAKPDFFTFKTLADLPDSLA